MKLTAPCAFILLPFCAFAQNVPVTKVKPDSTSIADIYHNSTVWQGHVASISVEKIAAYAAPVLWFSPDEPNMKGYQKDGIHIPEAFPFESATKKPVVYYKILSIFTDRGVDQQLVYKPGQANRGASAMNLDLVKVFYLDYYFYYASELGLGSHPHDIESVVMKMVVDKNPANGAYRIRVENVNGRAHGLYWYNNLHVADIYTKFPVTVLIEEGKHASCPDANGDGIYTPSYDVNVRTNDAWGIRDIIRGGTLFSGAYQSWMTKLRTAATIVSPPLPGDSPLYDEFATDTRQLTEKPVYELRPFPEAGQLTADKHLQDLVKDKKPVKWPAIKTSKKQANKIRGIPEDENRHPITLAYRQEENGGLTYIAPLLIVKNVAAPMTGGWFINKFYAGSGDYSVEKNNSHGDKTVFGHLVMHMSSASRWVDPYVGFGYEFNDYDERKNERHYKMDFASEFGFKIRFNLKMKSVFRRPKFLGIRIGYRLTGFAPIKESGLVLEIGAGAW
ncbi:MAG: hypothetical protein ABIQ88_17910 [Chitinophagaceae bacterium]